MPDDPSTQSVREVRTELHDAVENVASCAVATRTRSVLEGVLRQSSRYADGLRHDEHLQARWSA